MTAAVIRSIAGLDDLFDDVSLTFGITGFDLLSCRRAVGGIDLDIVGVGPVIGQIAMPRTLGDEATDFFIINRDLETLPSRQIDILPVNGAAQYAPNSSLRPYY
jgi:hypothetical protein